MQQKDEEVQVFFRGRQITNPSAQKVLIGSLLAIAVFLGICALTLVPAVVAVAIAVVTVMVIAVVVVAIGALLVLAAMLAAYAIGAPLHLLLRKVGRRGFYTKTTDGFTISTEGAFQKR